MRDFMFLITSLKLFLKIPMGLCEESSLKLDKQDVTKNENYQARRISGIEAQKMGLFSTKMDRKTVCREEKLPFLTCEHCSFQTKRPNHLAKHMRKHGILQ